MTITSDSTNASQTTNPANTAPRRSSSWPLAAVFITLILIVGGPVAYMLIRFTNGAANAPERFARAISQAAADAVRPRLTINEIVLNAIDDVHKQSVPG